MREVRIYQPAKTAMQSGRANTRKWLLEHEPAARQENEPLMGWVASADTRSQVRLRFSSREEAVAYAEKHGLDYHIEEPQPRRLHLRSYAANFS